jgi:hypothetical protein
VWIKARYQFQFGVLEQWGVIGGNFKDLKMCTLKLFGLGEQRKAAAGMAWAWTAPFWIFVQRISIVPYSYFLSSA